MQVLFRWSKAAQWALWMACAAVGTASAQQVVQRGALGTPAQVLDETQQWSTPLLVSSDHDVEMYIPDVSVPEWLARNYDDYEARGVYVLSMFTFYKTPKACRANQIAWGFSDAAHVDACLSIAYRVRQGSIDTQQKTVTLQMAAMVDQNGNVEPDSIERRSVTRAWSDLDKDTQAALEKANEAVAAQMRIYDRRMRQRH